MSTRTPRGAPGRARGGPRRRRHVGVAELERRNALKRIDANMQPVKPGGVRRGVRRRGLVRRRRRGRPRGPPGRGQGRRRFLPDVRRPLPEPRGRERADGPTSSRRASRATGRTASSQLLKRAAPVQADANSGHAAARRRERRLGRRGARATSWPRCVGGSARRRRTRGARARPRRRVGGVPRGAPEHVADLSVADAASLGRALSWLRDEPAGQRVAHHRWRCTRSATTSRRARAARGQAAGRHAAARRGVHGALEVRAPPARGRHVPRTRGTPGAGRPAELARWGRHGGAAGRLRRRRRLHGTVAFDACCSWRRSRGTGSASAGGGRARGAACARARRAHAARRRRHRAVSRRASRSGPCARPTRAVGDDWTRLQRRRQPRAVFWYFHASQEGQWDRRGRRRRGDGRPWATRPRPGSTLLLLPCAAARSGPRRRATKSSGDALAYDVAIRRPRSVRTWRRHAPRPRATSVRASSAAVAAPHSVPFEEARGECRAAARGVGARTRSAGPQIAAAGAGAAARSLGAAAWRPRTRKSAPRSRRGPKRVPPLSSPRSSRVVECRKCRARC